MRAFDLPPIWLAGFAAIVWYVGALWPIALFGNAGYVIGAVLVGIGILVMLFAIVQMTSLGTTVIPRRDPNALVTNGIFRLSRNPIYLADALILMGLILRWDAVLALPLVAAFIAVIQRRFIVDEEARLRAGFGAEFDAYMGRTRRWI